MSDSKGQVYKTKITPKAAMYGAVPLASAVVLAHFALDASEKFHPSDPTRIFFVGIPLVLSGIIIIALIVTANHFMGRTIGVRGNELLFKDGKTMLSLGIAEMAFSPPSDKAMLKTIMFSDGANFVQLPEIFMGSGPFADLLETIQKLRRVEDLSGQKTWSL
jgi:hypothetical protein